MPDETTDCLISRSRVQIRRVLQNQWTRSSTVEQDVSPTLVVTDEYHASAKKHISSSTGCGFEARLPLHTARGAARCFLIICRRWPVMQRRMPGGTTAIKVGWSARFDSSWA